MEDLTHDEIEHWAKEYRRLRYGLPRGTTFAHFIMAPHHYTSYAEGQLQDWSENTRIGPIAQHSPIILN